MKPDARPATMGDLARRFGVSPDLVAKCARQMVDKGIASPSMITVHGVPTLHGLMPQAPEVSPESATDSTVDSDANSSSNPA